jgi:hypothetical protein
VTQAKAQVPHPLADRIRDGYIHVESRSPVLFLGAAQADLLVQASEHGQRVVFVTDELTGLTAPFAQALQESDGVWVVRAHDRTLRDGITGRRLDSIASALDRGHIRAEGDVAVAFLRPETQAQVEIVITTSVRHRAEIETELGGAVELIARAMHGESPAAWDLLEPVDSPWDRAAMTALARQRMPRDTRFVARGTPERPFIATVHVARTKNGLEETTRTHTLVGEFDSTTAKDAVERVPGLLASLNDSGMPLISLAMARQRRGDQLQHPVLGLPPYPLALLIGPPGVRALDIDPERAVADWDAVVVGRPRIPGLLFPLGSLTEHGVDRLRDVLASFDADRLADALGLHEKLYREGTHGSQS